MKNFSFAKALTLGTLLCFSLPVACGDDDDNTNPMNTPSGGSDAGGDSGNNTPEGGAGGAAPAMLPPGLSTAASTKMCGADTCKSAAVGPAVFVDPCCDAVDGCGLNTGFLSLVGAKFKDVCQSRDQAGDPSDTCNPATGLIVPFQMGGTTLMVPLDPFAGCCRPDGTCGVVVDKVTSGGGKLPIADLGLGCVDAAPFANGVVTKCSGEGMGGAGGMSGGGAPGVAGAATGGAGGAP